MGAKRIIATLKILDYFAVMLTRAKTLETAEIFTVEEVATYLKVTERSVYRLLAKQAIPAFKVGGAWRFSKREIEKWIISNSTEMNGFKK